MSEVCDCAEIRLRVQWYCDVKSLRPRSFDPTRKAQLLQQCAHVQRRFAQHFQLMFIRSVAGWIEIKNADVGLVKVRRTRRPDVNRDAVLVREPQQRTRVSHNRMIDSALVLWNLDAFQPCRKTFRDVLLKEAGRGDTAVITLHRYGATPDVRQHQGRNARVVRREFSLRDAVVGKEDFLWMTNHYLTSRGSLSLRIPGSRGWRSLLCLVHWMKPTTA